jgi:hypothetical protein
MKGAGGSVGPDRHQIAVMMSDPGNVLFTLIPQCE